MVSKSMVSYSAGGFHFLGFSRSKERLKALKGNVMEYDSENNCFVFVDSNDDSHSIPAIYEVCGRCHGNGKHVNSNVDGHGISQEEFDEDPEFRDNYFNGLYDVPCEECNGLRGVSVPDLSGLSPELLEEIEEAEEEDARYESACRMERMMGC